MSISTTIIVGIIVLIVIIFVLRGVRIIPQAETWVIERLGKYNRTLESGINIIWPIIDRPRVIHTRHTIVDVDGNTYVRNRTTCKIDLREQVYDFPKQSVITKDNVTTTINALLYFQIIDPVKAVYEIDNLPNAIEKLTQTTLRNVIGELELDETLTSRDTINSKLRAVLDEASNKWGVKVTRVELQDITPPNSVRDAMERQMQAERERRAQVLKATGDKEALILESEGKKAALINQAEADKQTKILAAEGEANSRIIKAKAEAEAIAKINEALANSGMDPANYMLAEKYINTLKEMASGQDSKTVYMPYEASSMLGSIGCFKDMFQK
ncbi:MAG: SPFH domain-containing protein [Candidatus Cryptobacteroides sp.]|nr:SPFH/Band 7/PHB domain protein [Bacteroidales bacterium]MDY2706738.1 SPFH domain-containing protein [Candidatus Cryptobacteroides sp.]MCI6314979.1 SPFH/Band 7/PHB domain protein [Bacteroidales bacterium]MCI7750061.1 SPFH/Band 7/PHB domain protein [Bacteroidales bacterium]MDD6113842.1 SPFH/Band 7/PHB domain protein [Bacteroidales bacterium]